MAELQSVKYAISPGAGMLRPATQCPSPNQDERPPGVLPELIVLHGISLPPGEFGGPHVRNLFTNSLDPTEHPYFREIEGICVSSHLFIDRQGDVVQFVPFGRRAWHAGVSRFRGRNACNDFSIGIELEGSDEAEYTSPQYAELIAIVSALMGTYWHITPRHIAAHSDVAPGRKTDPGPAFDWMRLYDGLRRLPEESGTT